MAITKIDANTIEVSSEEKEVFKKDRLLAQKKFHEDKVIEITNLLKEF